MESEVCIANQLGGGYGSQDGLRRKLEVSMTTPDEIDRLVRIRRSTAEHSQRQGLYIGALGLLVGYLGFGLADGRDLSIVPLLLFVVMLAAVAGYYRKYFGTVVPRRSGARAWSWLAPVLSLLGALVVMTAANAAGQPGYLTAGLVFACLLALMSGAPGRWRGHYLVAAAVLAAVTLAPLGAFAGSGEHPFSHTDPLWQLVAFGAALVAVGLIDHRALVGSLPESAAGRA